eukprot:364896-Chlamydomonas_euryale.AAC.8
MATPPPPPPPPPLRMLPRRSAYARAYGASRRRRLAAAPSGSCAGGAPRMPTSTARLPLRPPMPWPPCGMRPAQSRTPVEKVKRARWKPLLGAAAPSTDKRLVRSTAEARAAKEMSVQRCMGAANGGLVLMLTGFGCDGPHIARLLRLNPNRHLSTGEEGKGIEWSRVV